jgi:predicted transcriptional regulator
MTPMKRIRTQVLKLSQIGLAEVAEVNQATVSRWDAGSREPGRVQMQRIREYARREGIKWSDKWFFEAAA